MTQKEKDEKYSNLCVQAGDHFTKMQYHQALFQKYSKEALDILTTKVEVQDGSNQPNSVS